MLKVGFGKVCITPPIGAPLAGFAARKGNCEGVHDDLYSRTLVIENEKKPIALISLEILAVSENFVKRVRENITKRTGIEKDAILIASTHTHAGPVTITTFFNPGEVLNERYIDSLAEAVEKSAVDAWENRFSARVGVGSGRVEGIGVNRRSRTKEPVDKEIGIIKVEDESGKLRAVAINYACHPTVLGSDNLLTTGDFPAFAIEKLEEEIGKGGFAMFFNGTQGNISMGHSSELSAIGVITPGRTFEHAEELGYKLAGAALKALEDIPAHASQNIEAIVSSVDFPVKDLPEPEDAQLTLQTLEKKLAQFSENEKTSDAFLATKSEHLYALITNYYARETAALSDGLLSTELQAIRIGDAMFLAIPAEVFVEIGMDIKRYAQQKTFIIGIANGYIGYMPTKSAYKENGYEVVSSKLSPESESLLHEEVSKFEKRVFSQTAETVSS